MTGPREGFLAEAMTRIASSDQETILSGLALLGERIGEIPARDVLPRLLELTKLPGDSVHLTAIHVVLAPLLLRHPAEAPEVLDRLWASKVQRYHLAAVRLVLEGVDRQRFSSHAGRFLAALEAAKPATGEAMLSAIQSPRKLERLSAEEAKAFSGFFLAAYGSTRIHDRAHEMIPRALRDLERAFEHDATAKAAIREARVRIDAIDPPRARLAEGARLQDEGRFLEAVDARREAAALAEQAHARQPNVTMHLLIVALAHGGIGKILESQGDVDGARAEYDRSLEAFDRLRAATGETDSIEEIYRSRRARLDSA